MGIETAIAIASGVAGLVGTVSEGVAAKNQADAQAAELRRQAEEAEIAADQEETARREQLREQLATVDAIRAARGLSGGSPTGKTIRRDQTQRGLRDFRVGRANALSRADAFRRSAQITQSAGRSALITSGIAGAGRGVSLIQRVRDID